MENLLFKIEIQGVAEQVEKLGQLRDEMNRLRKEQSELDKEYKAGNIETQRYHEQTGILQAKLQGLGQEQRTVKTQIDNSNKSFKAAEGSMTSMSLELTKLRKQYYDLSEAERNNTQVGGALLSRIQSLDSEIKKLDSGIGLHQRNVGNYKSALEGLNGAIAQNIPIYGQFQNAIKTVKGGMDAMAQASGKTSTGILAIGGVIGIATVAFGGLVTILKDTIKSSDSLQDKWEEMTTGMSFAYDNFLATIASGDWSNFFTNIESAYQAGVKYVNILDEISEKQLGYNITQAEDKAQMADIVILMKNRQLSDEQRIAYGKQYLELAKRIAAEEISQAKLQVDANRVMSEQKTGLGEATIKRYFIERSQNSALIDQAQELIEKQEKLDNLKRSGSQIGAGGEGAAVFSQNQAQILILQKDIDNTSRKVKDMAYVMTGVNKLSEDQQKQISEGYVSLTNARASYSESTTRAQTTINSLLAGQGDLEVSNQKKAEKTNETYKSRLKTLFENSAGVIAANNALITQLTRSAIDAQIMAMVDGAEKEKRIIDDKYEDERLKIEQIKADRISLVEKTIKEIQALPATGIDKEKQLKDIQLLEDQKVSISKTANALIEENEKEHLAKIKALNEKYSKTEEEKKIVTKYETDVKNAEEEYSLKLEVVKQYYSSQGTLTKEQSEKQHQEELKLAVDLAQKKYELLYNEIKARKELGVITVEEYDQQLKKIAELYKEVKKLQGEAAPETPEKKKTYDSGNFGDGIGTGLQNAFGNIMTSLGQQVDGEKALIIAKVAELLNNVQSMWLQSQQERIQAELKAETTKLDKLEKAELKDLQAKRKKGLITEKQYEEQKEKIDEKYEAAKLELQKEAFEKNKRLQIANALMSGAVAFVNALTVQPFWLGLVMAGLTAVMVALQVASISAQKFTGEKGGWIKGKPHSQGGEKFYSDNTTVELEGDEAIINKKSLGDGNVYTVSGTPRQIASGINQLNGNGVEFAPGAVVKKELSLEDIRNSYTENRYESGGIFKKNTYLSAVTRYSKLFESGGYSPAPTPRQSQQVNVSPYSTEAISEGITAALNDQKVIVVEREITEVQKRVKKVKIDATW